MLEHRIQTHFIESADLQYHAAEPLSKMLASAVAALLTSVTSGGKCLVAGTGGGAVLAHYFAALLVGRYERDRPGLPALLLHDEGLQLAAVEAAGALLQPLARQVLALGQAGDVLFLICPGGQTSQALAAVACAHEREMTVLALTGQASASVAAALRETDVHIGVPHERLARVQELQLLALHCICDGVDAQLLGEQEISI